MPQKKQQRKKAHQLQAGSSSTQTVNKTLSQDLQSRFPFSTDPQQLKKHTSQSTGNIYLFSNDQGMHQCADYIKSAGSGSSIKPENSCALLVGESYFLSLLPELKQHARSVIITDIDPRVLSNCHYMLQCMNQSRSPEEFVNHFTHEGQNPVLASKSAYFTVWDNTLQQRRRVPADKDTLASLFIGQAQDNCMSNYHFLGSQKRFDEVKQALESITVIPITYNWFDSKQTSDLKGILNRHQQSLKLLNLTNLYDYDMNIAPQKLHQHPDHEWYSLGNLKQNLKTLTKDNQKLPIIFYSTCDLSHAAMYTKMDAYTTQGLDNYFDAMTTYTNRVKQFVQLSSQLQNLSLIAQTQTNKQSTSQPSSNQPNQQQSSSSSGKLSSSHYATFSSQSGGKAQQKQSNSNQHGPTRPQKKSGGFGGFNPGFLNK